MRKNTFGFVICAAVAGLGLGLAMYGCGDSGSTTPNPLGPQKVNGQVIFDYNVLSQGLAKTDVSANIDNVKYVFSGTDSEEKTFTDVKDSYTYTFEHKSEAYDQQVTIDDVNINTTKVTAAYYDSNKNLVAIGVNELEWNETTKIAHVVDPQVLPVNENSAVSLTASSYVVPKGQQTALTLMVTPNVEGAKAIDMTSFAVFGSPDEKVLAPIAEQPGIYTGVEYSSDDGLLPTATIGKNIKATVDQPIYVTDQKLESLKISPADVDGVKITVLDKQEFYEPIEGGQYFHMLYADEKLKDNGYMLGTVGKKAVTFHPRNEYSSATPEARDISAAANDQPMQVIASYSNTEGKGPVPPQMDVTNDENTTIESKRESRNWATPSATDVDYMTVNGNVLHVDGVNTTDNFYSVSAKYKDLTSDSLTVAVSSASAYLAFVNKDTGEWMPARITYQNGGVNDYNMSLAAIVRTNSIWKYGEKCDFYLSEVIDIPTTWIAEGQYPNVKPVEIESNRIAEYKQTAAGDNGYSLKLGGYPKADTSLEIDRPEGATYPKLYSTKVVRW